jgi:16S rRNA (guanine966-N2)-methyltransferase
MRIIGGEYRNRIIKAPKGQDVRPTGERVREAIFNILYAQMDFEELTVADICCGTGALGLEALSRGAQFCTFVDLDVKPVTENLRYFDVDSDRFKLIRSLGQKVKLQKTADLVFVDPPYYNGIAEEIMKNASNVGKQGALWIVEVESKHELEINEAKFELVETRKYGHSRIYILRQK